MDLPVVTVTVLNGPHEGAVRTFPDLSIPPDRVLGGLSQAGYRWRLDLHPDLDPRIAEAWGVADMTMRIMSALTAGRTVWFDDRWWRCGSPAELEEIAGDIEDKLVASPGVVVTRDDGVGDLIIGRRE